jgi:hypothetical protein
MNVHFLVYLLSICCLEAIIWKLVNLWILWKLFETNHRCFFKKIKTTDSYGADWQSMLDIALRVSYSSNHQAPLMFQAGVGCWNTGHNTVVEVLMICNYIRPDFVTPWFFFFNYKNAPWSHIDQISMMSTYIRKKNLSILSNIRPTCHTF